jgi:hypothetical protein
MFSTNPSISEVVGSYTPFITHPPLWSVTEVLRLGIGTREFPCRGEVVENVTITFEFLYRHAHLRTQVLVILGSAGSFGSDAENVSSADHPLRVSGCCP